MKKFYKTTLAIALPVAVQQFISTSVNFVDTLMIGQLGESNIAAVGLSNKIFFLFNLLLFGLVSGGAIFLSQFWGKRDEFNISKTTSLITGLSIIFSFIFFIPTFFFTENVLKIFTPDPNVVSIGMEYLSIIALTFPVMAFVFSFEASLKSTEKTIIPMYSSLIAMGTNIFLNYILIFGKFGMPTLGVQGAAIGTLISRILQLSILIIIMLKINHPALFRIVHVKALDLKFIKYFFSYTISTIGQEFFWGLGMTTYSIVYAHMGTNIIAARNVMETMENIAFTVLIAISNATAIIVGKHLGSDNIEDAIFTAKKLLKLNFIVSFFMGFIIIISSKYIVLLFNVSQEVEKLILTALLIAAFSIPIRTINLMNVVGILRAGGDTKFSFFVEVGTLWGIGIPLVAISGLIIGWSFPIVYTISLIEELVKAIIFMKRYYSQKWARNIVDSI
jgi:putative MATE family efflux protein